ncbi:hypothetical protein AB1Y20_009203 [Prymnesium parvum]|uniref:DUF659 domain-containing protein n=1 Tax=Prymnesium parvum TaxID=97485 RepID=A0AB34K0X5_PRYPA
MINGEPTATPEPAVHGPRVGLAQTCIAESTGAKSRTATGNIPKRVGEIWKQVTVVNEHKTSPSLMCKHCSKTFCGGVTRIKTHIIDQCTNTTEAFLEIKQKILDVARSESAHKRQKTVEDQVDMASMCEDSAVFETTNGVGKSRTLKKGATLSQQSIMASVNSSNSVLIDNAIADLFYGTNIPAEVVEHPLFKRVVEVMKTAPASYKPPTSARLLDDLLISSTQRHRAAEAPMREAFLKEGGTVMSDGWDDIQSNHLVNLLIGTSRGMFFEGTVKFMSTDTEDASAVAKLISDEIKLVGPLKVVQVVTDTCAVMKAAWKLLESEYPWITCTCCAPHVLSLYLKDIGTKIPAVEKVIAKVQKVLKRFWGKTRWARARLREVTTKNHGHEIGLHRAKVTRFAGKVREMGRILRLKGDLQQIVVSPDYTAQKFILHEDTNNEAGDTAALGEVLGANDPVRIILLDEDGFWAPLVDALKVMTPIVKLLRLTDGTAPAMGKILPRMEAIREATSKLTIDWKDAVLDIHDKRWDYLQSPMHFAGTALDPEFLTRDLNQATQNGLIEVAERLALRSEMLKLEANGCKDATSRLNPDSECVQDAVAVAMLQISAYQEKEGVFSKPFVQKSAKQMAPATWWATFGKGQSMIASMAYTILGQPVCASAAGLACTDCSQSTLASKYTRSSQTSHTCQLPCTRTCVTQ